MAGADLRSGEPEKGILLGMEVELAAEEEDGEAVLHTWVVWYFSQ